MNTIHFKAETLPTKGLFYPPDFTVELTKYSLAEVEKIADQPRDLQELIDDFEASAVYDKKVNILYPDFLYMMLYRTGTIYNNNTLELDFVCKNSDCRKSYLGKIKYTEVELFDFDKYLDILPVPLTLNTKEYLFNLPTINHIKQIIKLHDAKLYNTLYTEMKKHEQDEEFSPEDSIQLKLLENKVASYVEEDILKYLKFSNRLISFGIVSSQDMLETMKALENVSDGDTLEILELVDTLTSSAFKPYEISCPHCGAKSQISLEGVAVLLRPFCPSTDSIADKIRASRKITPAINSVTPE